MLESFYRALKPLILKSFLLINIVGCSSLDLPVNCCNSKAKSEIININFNHSKAGSYFEIKEDLKNNYYLYLYFTAPDNKNYAHSKNNSLLILVNNAYILSLETGKKMQVIKDQDSGNNKVHKYFTYYKLDTRDTEIFSVAKKIQLQLNIGQDTYLGKVSHAEQVQYFFTKKNFQ